MLFPNFVCAYACICTHWFSWQMIEIKIYVESLWPRDTKKCLVSVCICIKTTRIIISVVCAGVISLNLETSVCSVLKLKLLWDCNYYFLGYGVWTIQAHEQNEDRTCRQPSCTEDTMESKTKKNLRLVRDNQIQVVQKKIKVTKILKHDMLSTSTMQNDTKMRFLSTSNIGPDFPHVYRKEKKLCLLSWGLKL
jgi:hypothetical protein